MKLEIVLALQAGLSTRQVMDLCGVSQPLVFYYRKQLEVGELKYVTALKEKGASQWRK